MPRRSLFTASERAKLLAFPSTDNELMQYYTFSDTDLAVIRQRRGNHNRLGFAVQLCYLRYPGFALQPDIEPPHELLAYVSLQLHIDPNNWYQYAKRPETRREHLAELQVYLNLKPFSADDYRDFVHQLCNLSKQTDRGIVLAEALLDIMRHKRIIIPSIDVIERICSEALTMGTRQVYENLSSSLSGQNKEALDGLLIMRDRKKVSGLIWMRLPPGSPRPKHILAHIERLNAIEELHLPEGLGFSVHQNRLMKLAREGGQMTSQHLRDLESVRRYATLVAVVLDSKATLIDEIIELHDRIIGTIFSKAKRNHSDSFHKSGKAINEKVRLYSRIGRALLEAKQSGGDPFAAIEAIIPWEMFSDSVNEAEKLAQPKEFDYLPLIGKGFNKLRRYTPSLLNILKMKAAPVAQDLMEAIEVLKEMNDHRLRKVPENAPTSFVRKRWENLVFTADGIDRKFYELCVFTELRNALRSGDIWVIGSRQFKDFEEYLLPKSIFSKQLENQELGIAVETKCDRYIESRLAVLEKELATVERLAAKNELPDASITCSGLKINQLDNSVPDEAISLIHQAYSLMPHLKITELLLEVDSWTGFTKHFRHLKNGQPPGDKYLILTVILADAINLGLSKMAESCPGTTYSRLTWLQAWHIRDDTYSAALAELVNVQFQHPFATHWGDGTSSSSDGQNFRVGGHGKFAGQVNLKYGRNPGIQFYTHISDQYAPFHTKVINSTVRDATHVLDGLLYHESDLRIEEHYTDTSGFTDHVFGLMHLLGFRFVPRIRDLADKRIYINGDPKKYPTLASLIGGNIKLKHIRSHWDEILRLAASIRQGTVSASLMLRKLGSYPRQNGLAVALRQIGFIERTLFMLDWMKNVELRRRVNIGLNKGESKNALARTVFLNRQGEIRDRSFENQRYRASGLNLVVAAIILWDTVYLELSIKALRDAGVEVNESLLQHLSPVGWEHINLTGDYVWKQNRIVAKGQFRPLRKYSDP
ncbi:MAG: Tn3 family transposase [Candidatus Aminicenantes bacterium]|jgi:TnpA family transposase